MKATRIAEPKWKTFLVALSFLTQAAFTSVVAADFPATRSPTAGQWNDRGNKFAEQQQWQSAIDAFSEAIKLSPKRSELFVNRAVAYQKLGQWRQAEEECTAAIKLNSENTRAFLQRAIARSELGRNRDAFKDGSRAARMEPDNAQCVFIRYLTASRLGRYDLGYPAGETYIGIREWKAGPTREWTDPWSPYVALLNYVGLRRAGDGAAARGILGEAAASMPAQIWPTPVIHYLRGDLDEETVLSLANGDTGRETLARYYVGIHEWLDGDSSKAREQFEWIIAHGDHAYLQFKLAGDHLKEMTKLANRPASSSEK